MDETGSRINIYFIAISAVLKPPINMYFKKKVVLLFKQITLKAAVYRTS